MEKLPESYVEEAKWPSLSLLIYQKDACCFNVLEIQEGN